MTLAVFGGSFDPVHNGHIAMARYVLDKGLTQKVVVVPAFQSPFKSGSFAPGNHRLIMARLGFAEIDQAYVDDLELRRLGPSFMVDTLKQLQKDHPQNSLKLVVGADNVAGFFQWEKPEEILSLAQIIVLGRQGSSFEIPAEHKKAFFICADFDQKMSSTEIRVMLTSRNNTEGFLPPAVAQYIQTNQLYL